MEENTRIEPITEQEKQQLTPFSEDQETPRSVISGTPRRRRSERYHQEAAETVVPVSPTIGVKYDEKPFREESKPENQAAAPAARFMPGAGITSDTELPDEEIEIQLPRRSANPYEAGDTVRRPAQMKGFTQEEPASARFRSAGNPNIQLTPYRGTFNRQNDRRTGKENDGREETYKEKSSIQRVLTILTIVVIVLGLAAAALIMLPGDADSGIGKIRTAISSSLDGLFGGHKDDTQPKILSFSAEPVQGVAPMPVLFTVMTSKDTEALRAVNDDGQVIGVGTITADNNENRLWVFQLLMTEAFDDDVSLEVLYHEKWIRTVEKQHLTIAAPENALVLPVDTPAPEETAAPYAETEGPVVVLPAVDDPLANLPEPGSDDHNDTETDPMPTEEPVVLSSIQTDVPAPTQDMSAFGYKGVMGETATPVPEVTAEPSPATTEVPTPEPTAIPTPVPTEEPVTTEAPAVQIEESPAPESIYTAEPTFVPQPTPTATPEPTPIPPLAVSAVKAADPAIITETLIYQNNQAKPIGDYSREKSLNMPAGDDYLVAQNGEPYGVLTFRGNAYRQNAAVQRVSGELNGMHELWRVTAGSVKASDGKTVYYGFGWTGQPVITKWSKDVRLASNIKEEKKAVSALKEVIIAGYDGNIYFLDLADGKPTRDIIKVGSPMRGTPALSSLGYPVMAVGNYARKMASGAKDMGIRVYNLLTQKQSWLLDGLDAKLGRPYYSVGAFDTSPLFDRNSDTMIAVGTNGMLYTVSMATEYDFNLSTVRITPSFMAAKMRTANENGANTAVESSPAMAEKYVFYADTAGVLRCVDTDTMKPVWALKTLDNVQAAISLDYDEDGTLKLYTANVLKQRKKGGSEIRCLDAMTGEVLWMTEIPLNNKITKYVPGAKASAVIGANGLDELVYYTISGVTKDFLNQYGAAGGDSALVALDKKNGRIQWVHALTGRAYSSPVAVYNKEGKGWVIQFSDNGLMELMDGLSGEVVASMTIEGTVEASPAVYRNILVIGTTGKNTSYVYGIQLDSVQ